MKTILSFAAIGLALVAALPASADEQSMENRRADVRAITLRVLEHKLALDAPAAQRVEKVVERFREPIEAVRVDSFGELKELRQLLVTEKPDDKRIKKLSEQLLSNRVKLQRLEDDRLKEMGRQLTPPQMAKLLVSWRAVKRAIRREVRARAS